MTKSKEKPKPWLKVAEVVFEFGVTRQSVYNLIHSKKLTSKTEDGHKIVSRETCQAYWGDAPKKQRQRRVKAGEDLTANPNDTKETSERVEAYWKAKQRETTVKKAMAELVPIAEVKSRVFEGFRMLRDGLQQIPDRVAPELAAEVDPHQLAVRLRREIDTVLESFSDRVIGDASENRHTDQPMDQ